MASKEPTDRICIASSTLALPREGRGGEAQYPRAKLFSPLPPRAGLTIGLKASRLAKTCVQRDEHKVCFLVLEGKPRVTQSCRSKLSENDFRDHP